MPDAEIVVTALGLGAVLWYWWDSVSARDAALRAVHGAGGAAFVLHFNHGGDVAPDVGDLLGGPFIGQFSHRRRRRDRVNGADLT